MTENPNAPDPRIGEISKALDEFEDAVKDANTDHCDEGSNADYIRKFARNGAREKLMNLIRRLNHHV